MATALAQRGRSNGFLSAIEDAVFTGYAAGAPSALGAAGTSSLVDAIDAMAYVPDSVRQQFESQWSDPAIVDPALLVRRVLESPIVWRTLPQNTLIDALPPPCADRRFVGRPAGTRESLLMLAADARARGIVTRRARYRPGSLRPGVAQSVLGEPGWLPQSGERLVQELRSAILSQLGTALPDQGVVPVAPAIFRSKTVSCSSMAR